MGDSGNAKKGAERYLNFLAEEGFRPTINANDNVSFKCEGRTYVIRIDEEDEEYFELAYPNFWPIESDEERSRVMEAALAVIADNKVVKIYPEDDTNTWATIELFCSPPETFKPVFNRCLRVLRGSVNEFVATMQDAPKQDDAFVFHLPKYNAGRN